VPDGTLVGFLDVAGLPAGPVTLEGMATVEGTKHRLPKISRTAETTYPNGPQCGPGGNRLNVRLDAEGLR
jgi:hypothetical protein